MIAMVPGHGGAWVSALSRFISFCFGGVFCCAFFRWLTRVCTSVQFNLYVRTMQPSHTHPAMRLSTFFIDGHPELCALVDGDTRLVRLAAAFSGQKHQSWSNALASMLGYLQAGISGFDCASEALEAGLRSGHDDWVLSVDSQRAVWLAPLPVPESIREFMSFEQHVINCARKFGMSPRQARWDEWVEKYFGRGRTRAYRDSKPWYERPVYYKGNRFSVVGHQSTVRIPAYTRAFDWELEFGIVLSKGGRNIPPDRARECIGGYMVFNDFSARDIQGREMGGRLGPAKGKDFDTGNAMGPVLVTPDELPDPYNLRMQARINGKRVSDGHSSGMRFKFEDMIAYVSQSETLYPGEFFGSGTATVPESGENLRGCGVEMGVFLKPGDVIELEVEHLGVLRNPIAAEE